MTREEIMQLNTDYLNNCESEQEMNELFAYVLELQKYEQEPRWIPVSDKYEYHIDHTDCIWYGNDSGCPCTCSQYRDGWNDAMNYIFKDGKGYQPYRRDTDG